MEEATKTKSLSRGKPSETLYVTEDVTPFSDLDEEVRFALACAQEKKAADTVILDLREITSFTEYFLITSGTNQRHVQAIADEINEKLKKEMGVRAIRIEGYSAADWILLDYGDFVFHVFNEESRRFYDLERLWRDAKRVALPDTESTEQR